MPRLPFLFLALTLACGLATAEEPKPAPAPGAPGADVRELSLEGYKSDFPQTTVDAPTTISSAEELAKAFTDKDVLDRLKKDVDFTKEKLLFFAWSGSGQDKLSHMTDDKKEIVFSYLRGRTKDLRSHHKLFAIGKDAKWKVAVRVR